MIELFSAPAYSQFLAYRPKPDPGVEGPFKLQLVSDSHVIEGASDEAILDLMSMIEVHAWFESNVVAFKPQMPLYKLFYAANQIAATSRRAIGNICVGSSVAITQLPHDHFVSEHNASEDVIAAREFPGTFTINESVPDDELWVFYFKLTSDGVDGPFAWDGNSLRIHPEWSRYCCRVVI